MTDSNLVFPGQEVASEEEYLAAEGTFAEDGVVYASQVGELVLDDDNCVARVISPNPPNVLAVGDIVYAVVGDIRSTMATADVYVKDGVKRTLGGDTYATIHVSKISPKYTDDVGKELRKGDFIRAKVTAIKPALQLTTKDDHLGVIRAQCAHCKTELVISKKGDGLFCPECRVVTPRKLADDYGDMVL